MNVSLAEIVVILLVALLVIKPEQLPDVATTLGRFVRMLRSLLQKTKDELGGLINSIEKSDEHGRK